MFLVCLVSSIMLCSRYNFVFKYIFFYLYSFKQMYNILITVLRNIYCNFFFVFWSFASFQSFLNLIQQMKMIEKCDASHF